LYHLDSGPNRLKNSPQMHAWDVPEMIAMPVTFQENDNDSEATGFPVSGNAGCGSVDASRPILAQSTGPAVPAAPRLMRPMSRKDVKAIKDHNLSTSKRWREGPSRRRFGYISGGSGVNWTRYENVVAFDRIHIEPQSAVRPCQC